MQEECTEIGFFLNMLNVVISFAHWKKKLLFCLSHCLYLTISLSKITFGKEINNNSVSKLVLKVHITNIMYYPVFNIITLCSGVVPIVLQSIAIFLKFCNTYCNTLIFFNTLQYCCNTILFGPLLDIYIRRQ